jgi:O-antigen ligase
MTALLGLFVLLCAVLPTAYVAAAMPAIWLTQVTVLGTRAALFSAGSVDVTLGDVVLLTLIGKTIFSIIRTREVVVHGGLYFALAIFVAVNAFATIAAGLKFGGLPMVRGLTALARLCSEIALIPILAQAVRSLPQARRCVQILLVTLSVLAAIQFINFLGASHGIVIGEVQGVERGETRYFGPVGDSIGMVLLLGYLCALCYSSVLGIGAFLGGIMLTAGLGAIFATGVGTALFLLFGLRGSGMRTFFARYFWLLPMLGFAAVVAVATVGKPLAQTLLDRLGDGGYSSSAGQRLGSVSLGAAMVADNPGSGVGYAGYEQALERYGGEKVFNLAHSDGATSNANNQLLQSLTDAGIPGLLALLWLIFSAARLLRGVADGGGDRFVATFYLAAFLWLLAQTLGNQAAVWLTPASYTARLLWIILGTGVALTKLLPANVPASAPDSRLARPQSPFVPA